MSDFTYGDVLRQLKGALEMVRAMKDNSKGEDRAIYGDVEKGLFLVTRKLSWHITDPNGMAGTILIFKEDLLEKLIKKP